MIRIEFSCGIIFFFKIIYLETVHFFNCKLGDLLIFNESRSDFDWTDWTFDYNWREGSTKGKLHTFGLITLSRTVYNFQSGIVPSKQGCFSIDKYCSSKTEYQLMWLCMIGVYRYEYWISISNAVKYKSSLK